MLLSPPGNAMFHAFRAQVTDLGVERYQPFTWWWNCGVCGIGSLYRQANEATSSPRSPFSWRSPATGE